MKRGIFLFILLICFNSCLANNCVNCCDVPLLEKYFNVNSKYNQHSEFKSDQFISPAPSCNILCNTDFEDDKLVALGRFGFFHEDLVSCWATTATDRQIEIWGSGFGGVPAYSG
ncbi:MAG TPA: hypothetical protein PK209_14395, partial [Saprospiraceae bacterium]|nr:hypothetical protein [Saprospiraceae bacterium]